MNYPWRMPFDPDSDPWDLDVRAYRRTVERARARQVWFRPTYEGFENLRGLGGTMLVANHGLFGHELLPLLVGAWDHAHRPIRALADHVLFATPVQRRWMRARGAAEGTRTVAHRLMSRGEIVYVCPGGAREALADAKLRYTLLWDGHDGFVRSAIRASAAIVPMAILGHDETYRQLRTAAQVRRTPFGRLIEHAVGPKYVTPMYLGLGPAPLPQRFHFLVGTPIPVPADPGLADDEDTVAELHRRTKLTLEQLLARAQLARAQRLAAMPDGPRRWFEERLLELAR